MNEIDELEIEAYVLTRLQRLNAVVNGIVLGLVTGSVIFLATMWLVIKGGKVIGPNLSLLGQFFYGYRVTVAGAFVGFGYGFLIGFLLGYAIAVIYNFVVELRQPKKNAGNGN